MTTAQPTVSSVSGLDLTVVTAFRNFLSNFNHIERGVAHRVGAASE